MRISFIVPEFPSSLFPVCRKPDWLAVRSWGTTITPRRCSATTRARLMLAHNTTRTPAIALASRCLAISGPAPSAQPSLPVVSMVAAPECWCRQHRRLLPVPRVPRCRSAPRSVRSSSRPHQRRLPPPRLWPERRRLSPSRPMRFHPQFLHVLCNGYRCITIRRRCRRRHGQDLAGNPAAPDRSAPHRRRVLPSSSCNKRRHRPAAPTVAVISFFIIRSCLSLCPVCRKVRA